MMEKAVNEDFEKTSNSIKNPDDVVNVIGKTEKNIRSKESSILWLAYQQAQIFEKFKANENFIDMIKKRGISKYTILFKIFIVTFVSKYSRMKKCSLSLHFVKNSFKMIKEICHKNACEFK